MRRNWYFNWAESLTNVSSLSSLSFFVVAAGGFSFFAGRFIIACAPFFSLVFTFRDMAALCSMSAFVIATRWPIVMTGLAFMVA